MIGDEVADLARDYTATREWFLIDGTDMELNEWLREEAALPVPHEINE